MIWCGITLSIFGFILLLVDMEPMAISRDFGAIIAGIIIAIVGIKKHNSNHSKETTNKSIQSTIANFIDEDD